MVPYKTPREAGYYAVLPVKQGVGTFLLRFAAFPPEVTRELGRGGGIRSIGFAGTSGSVQVKGSCTWRPSLLPRGRYQREGALSGHWP